MRTPFDIALENHELDLAREIYALKHGAPRTSAYIVAWLHFSRRIRTIDDLKVARLATAFRTQTATPKNPRHGSSMPRYQAAQQAPELEPPSGPNLGSTSAAQAASAGQGRAGVTS